MWPSITRARRRIGDVLAPAPAGGTVTPDAAAEPVAAAQPTVSLEDVVIVLDGHDLDALQDALAATVAMDDRPDTPARLATALTAFVRTRGSIAVPRVVRLPAGLSTPEAWEIRFDSIDARICAAIREAARTGSLEP